MPGRIGHRASQRTEFKPQHATAEEAFWSKIDKGGGPAACWPWSGPRTEAGYGKFSFRKALHRAAHRVAWELTNGPIADGLFVCHRCDNPPCCNPAHLFLGTPKANTADMVAKGRCSRGSQRHNARVDEDVVRAIRQRAADGATEHTIAAEFSLSRSQVHRIVHRLSWTWVLDDAPPRPKRKGNQRLTEDQVLEIRRRHPAETVTSLAKAFGVSRPAVSAIVRGEAWKELMAMDGGAK